MSIFEGAYEHLKTARSTTVESERAFSSLGQICTKKISRQNDETFDALCFLRAHFQNS